MALARGTAGNAGRQPAARRGIFRSPCGEVHLQDRGYTIFLCAAALLLIWPLFPLVPPLAAVSMDTGDSGIRLDKKGIVITPSAPGTGDSGRDRIPAVPHPPLPDASGYGELPYGIVPEVHVPWTGGYAPWPRPKEGWRPPAAPWPPKHPSRYLPQKPPGHPAQGQDDSGRRPGLQPSPGAKPPPAWRPLPGRPHDSGVHRPR